MEKVESESHILGIQHRKTKSFKTYIYIYIEKFIKQHQATPINLIQHK